METDNITPTGKKFLDKSFTTRELIFLLAVVLCASPLMTAPVALITGLMIAQFIGNPYQQVSQKATAILLQVSVIGLGFRMNVTTALQAGKEGLLLTVATISGTLLIGFVIGRIFKINSKTAYLIAAGTAICGGSAIATISPVIKAEDKQISVALGTVFLLNAAALLVFPYIGSNLDLNQTQFGIWCAIAIHDTSSVVGAAGSMGNEALDIAVTVKLARALWIIPVAILSTLIFKNKNAGIKIPYYIGLFVLAIFLNTYVPALQQYSHSISRVAQSAMMVALFLIGCNVSGKTVKAAGIKPVLLGIILWVIVSISTLFIILYLK